MPIYKVQAPNGKVYNIEGPANADQNALFQAANQLYEQDENKRYRKEYGPGLLGTFAEGVGRGVDQMQTAFGDVVPAMFGSALGFEDYAKAQMQEAAEAQQRIQAENPPVFGSYKEVESPYQALQFAAEVFGEQVPNIATAIIPGVGGGALAGRAALATVNKALTAQAAKRGLVGEAAQEFVEEGMKLAAPSIAAKSAAGANVGTFLGSYSLNAPEVFQNVFEETGKMEVGTSLLFAAGSAALDSVLPASLAKQITGPMKVGIVEKVLEKSGMDKGLLRSTTAGLLKGTATEGLTEGAQEAISIAAERFVDDNPEVFGSKEWDRIMEASVRGAVAGGGFGTIGGAAQRLREASQRKAQLADALERRGQRQEAAQLRQEVAQAEREIAELQSREPQMQLPEMEAGVYTGLVQPEEVIAQAKKAAKSALGGKQLSMFGVEGELTKEAEKAATADQKRVLAATKQQAQREAQREAQEQKANQERIKKFLKSKQITLPGFSAEEVAQTQRQYAAAQAQFETEGQGDLLLGMPTTPSAMQMKREAEAQKAEQARLKKFLHAKQSALPGESAEEFAEAQRQQAEVQKQIDALRQGDLFVGMPTESATPPQPTKEQLAKEEKAEANRARQAEQRQAAQVKEDAAALKKALAELTNVPTDLVSLAKGPTPLVQTIRQAQGELDALSAKRAPKATPTTPTAEPAGITEPTKRAAPSGLEGTIIPQNKKDLAAFGYRMFNIGNTATILREDGPLAGKDLADPVQAAVVKAALEDYASKKPAKGAADKIAKFLEDRPEFKATKAEVPSGQAITEPVAGAVEPSLPSTAERQGDVGTAGATVPVSRGVGVAGMPAGRVDGGEGLSERSLTPRQARIAFGKALGAAQSYPGDLYGRTNKKAQTAAKRGDFAGVISALENSKNATVAEIARRAKNLKTKIRIDEDARETFTTRSTVARQESVDWATMHLEALDKLRELAPKLATVPDQARLPFDVLWTPITAIENGQVVAIPLGLADFVKNNHSMFAPLGLPANAEFKTKADFNALHEAFERATAELGEDALRITSTASANVMGVAGAYDVDTDTIRVPEYAAKKEGVLAHEIVHAQVAKAVANPTPAQRPAIARLTNLYTYVRQELEAKAKADEYFQMPYGVTNVQEFIAEGMSDPKFQYLLTKIEYKNTSAWDTFVSAIAQLLGLKHDTAFTELLSIYTELTPESPKKRTKKLSLPAHRGPDLDTSGRTLAEAGNLKGLVTHLQTTTTSKPLKAILGKIKGLNLGTKVVIGPVGEGQSGSFDPRTNTITLDPQNGLNEHTALHELVHAAISHVLRNPNLPVTKQLTTLFEQLQNQLGAAYGGQDIQEFASELVSNPEFQALLKTLKAPKSESMFARFMRTLAEFFGFAKGTNAYDKGLKLINDAIDISADVDPSVGDLLFLGTPNGQKTGLGVVGRIGQAMPSLTGEAVEATRNYVSNMPSGARSVAMALLRLDQINEIYKGQLPSLQKLIDALELRAGMQEKRIAEINKKYIQFQKVQKKHPQAMVRMNAMAIDARREQVDVIDPKFKPTLAQQAAYQRLKTVYNNLHPDVQQVYRDIRADYDGAINEYEDTLLNAIEDPSAQRKLKAQYEARKRQISYIPFLRRGDFWVEYDENGERAVQAFESVRERQKFIDTQLKGKQYTAYRNLDEATYSQGSLPPTSFIVGVMNQLTKQNASQELKDSVYQSYLALFPAESLAKNFMKSENLLGMERDIVRGYGETMIKWARKLATSKYSPEIDKALKEIATQGENASKAPKGEGAYAAAQNIMHQAQFIHNPTYSGLVSAMTTLSYFTYIAGNISSALINLTTLPMFSWSTLGAKYGFDKAASALFASSKVATNYIFSGKVPPKYAKLFEALNDHAQLEHTTAREVMEGRRQSTSDFIGLKAKIMDGISIPFAKTEVLNRGATAIAAYDLALASGKSEADAIRYALDTNKQLNTSGLGAAAPRYMQHPVGRVFFTFKTFTWNSAFVVGRAFHQAFKGESLKVRREAQRQLLGIYGMTMAFAGAQGLPFMGAVSTLAEIIAALFGDEDEPFDFKLEMRQFMGDLLSKGGLNYATNLEIANRTGVANDLLFRDDPQSVAEHGYVLTAMQQAFGPLGSYAVSVGRGAELVAEGQLQRGVEAMLPTFIKNGMKGVRYMEEGVLNLKGEPVIEDISTYNMLMQVVGFSPANLSNVYEEISMKKGFQRDMERRRTQLLNKYDMAQRAGDYDLLMEVQEDIATFNQRRIDPKDRITPDTLRKSIRAREAAEKNTINGVRFSKSFMAEVDQLLDEEE